MSTLKTRACGVSLEQRTRMRPSRVVSHTASDGFITLLRSSTPSVQICDQSRRAPNSCSRSIGPLRVWDFVHTPARVEHTLVGAGDGPCVIVAVGARVDSTGPNWGAYPVNETALRHNAGVERETTDVEEAYARFERRGPTRYQEGWLP